MVKRAFGLVAMILFSCGLSVAAGCGGDDKTAPCGETFCSADEVCCVNPPHAPVCVAGSTCPATK